MTFEQSQQEQAILKQVEQVASDGPFLPQWDALKAYRVPSWYEDAKFGIFIHWGVYSVPAFGNEWYPRNMYQPGTPEFAHHVETYGSQETFGYKDFIPQFTAARFDAREWATLFKEAGAKFVVPVAEHHDGFAMYDTSLSEWNAAQMGPKRDVVGELAAAVRAEGMVFGVSSHRAEHWFFFDGGRTFPSDVQDARFDGLYGPAQPKPADQFDIHAPERPDAAYLDNWLARTCELVDKYQPQLVWFDWWIQHEAFPPYLQKFAAYYYNRAAQWNEGVAINYKFEAFAEGTAVFDVERGQLAGIRPQLWQTDTSVSMNSWCYIHGHQYKSAGSIIGDLVDIVSKNGVLLLNIGPKPDGTIPDEEQQLLREIGQWLAVNGEAIYGTRHWKTFGEGPTQVTAGAFTDSQRPTFTGQDVRYTTKDDTLYAIALAWPGETLILHSLAASAGLASGVPQSVELLGHGAPLAWEQTPDGLTIQMPAQQTGEHAWVLKISGLSY